MSMSNFESAVYADVEVDKVDADVEVDKVDVDVEVDKVDADVEMDKEVGSLIWPESMSFNLRNVLLSIRTDHSISMYL